MIALIFFANEWYPRPLSSIFDAEFFIQILSRMPLDKIYDLADQIETLWTPTEEGQTEIAPFYRHRKMYDDNTPQLIKEFSQFALLCYHEKTSATLSSTLHREFYRRIAHGVLKNGRRYLDRDSVRALMIPIAFEIMLGLSACLLPAYVLETILFWLWRAYDIVERKDEHSFWIHRCILFHKRLMQKTIFATSKED